jgi:predicted HNH restriction endonuclease
MTDSIPSAQRYRKAFLALGESLPASYRAMLVAHFKAPAHTITTKQLAKRVGYANYNAAVLHYGTLGGLLCDELDFTPSVTDPNGDPIATFVLADAPRQRTSGELQWTMRPQVVEALIDLGWVNGKGTEEPLDEDEDEDEEDFPEGRVLYRQHRQRERNLNLVKKVKSRAERAGMLRCVICKFDFFKVYGDLGKGFIECHHTAPLSS